MEGPALSYKRMAGVTLVELIVAIVIVGTALAGLVAAYNRANIGSADPMITQQMLAVAETMMEEVMLKPYDTNGAHVARPANRAQYTEVGHYHGFASDGIADVDGAPIAGLQRYRVEVDVAPVTLTGASGKALRIRVTVRNGDRNLQLSGWRTSP